MLEHKIRKIIEYVNTQFPHCTDWIIDSIEIKKYDSSGTKSFENIDFYDIHIKPTPAPIHLNIIRDFLAKNLKLYIYNVYVTNEFFIRIHTKDENELKILMRPEKIKEILS